MSRRRPPVQHYHHGALWDVNLCGVRGTWVATGDPKNVTCPRCRRHLTYWVRRGLRARRRPRRA